MSGRTFITRFTLAAIIAMTALCWSPTQTEAADHPLQYYFCPPAYCRKPLPQIGAPACCLPGSYCRKPLPLTHPVICGICPTYVPKPLPACPPRACPCR